MNRIGIDMGGTNLRVALVDEAGIIRKVVVPCPADAKEPEVVLEKMVEIINEIITPEVESIGVGVPSVVDVEKGIVYNVANIPSWVEVHLAEYLSGKFPNVRICVNNDANCFALGEATYGAGKGFKEVVGLTLGTGTGAGIIVDGRVYNGSNIGAGEVGYLPYMDSFYENYTSGAFFNARGVNSKEAAIMARNGDVAMMDLWKEFGKHVGSLIKSLILAYDPEAIVVGGGMAGAADLYEDAMRESLKDFYYPKSVEKLKLSFLANPDAALLGAAALN